MKSEDAQQKSEANASKAGKQEGSQKAQSKGAISQKGSGMSLASKQSS